MALLISSQQDEANIIHSILEGNKTLSENLKLSISSTFNVKDYVDNDKKQKLLITSEINKKAQIKLNVFELLKIDFDPTGFYVRDDCSTSRRLLGKIKVINKDDLELDDLSTKKSRIALLSAYVEPSLINLVKIISFILRKDENEVFDLIIKASAQQLSISKKLSYLETSFEFLRRKLDKTPQGLRIRLDKSLLCSQSKYFPKHHLLEKPYLAFDPSLSKTDNWNQHGLDTYGLIIGSVFLIEN